VEGLVVVLGAVVLTLGRPEVVSTSKASSPATCRASQPELVDEGFGARSLLLERAGRHVSPNREESETSVNPRRRELTGLVSSHDHGRRRDVLAISPLTVARASL